MIDLLPDSFFTFNFNEGKIAYTNINDQAIIIPASALVECEKIRLSETSTNPFYLFGICIGKYFGSMLNKAFDGKGMESDIPPEKFLDTLNTITSLHGFGLISMENWSDVLVFDWQFMSRSDVSITTFKEGFLAGILKEFSGKDFEVTSVENGSGSKGKFIAGNPKMIKSTRQWIEEGAGIGEIIVRLKNGLHLK
jgi:predicted hydrocarbon binding protein